MGMQIRYLNLSIIEIIHLVSVVDVKNDIIVPKIVVMANPFTGPVPN
jgi:hypothetical protein